MVRCSGVSPGLKATLSKRKHVDPPLTRESQDDELRKSAGGCDVPNQRGQSQHSGGLQRATCCREQVFQEEAERMAFTCVR